MDLFIQLRNILTDIWLLTSLLDGCPLQPQPWPAGLPATRTGGLPSSSGLWLPASGPRRLRAVPSASGPGLSSPRLSASDRPSSSLPDAGAASSLRRHLQAGSARLQLPTSARQHYRRGSGTANDGDHHSRVNARGGSLGNGCMCCPLLPLHPDRVWCVCHLSRFLHPRPHLVRRGPVDQRKVAEEQRLHQYRPQRRCCCVHRGAPRCCSNPSHCGRWFSLLYPLLLFLLLHLLSALQLLHQWQLPLLFLQWLLQFSIHPHNIQSPLLYPLLLFLLLHLLSALQLLHQWQLPLLLHFLYQWLLPFNLHLSLLC